jgi:hypothetical protein
MTYRAFLAAVVLLSLAPLGVQATDLAKIDRTIKKEPAYKNKPKYCLLVFGLEAKHRVWLALDRDTLYVDRDGNGTLSEKIAAEKSERDEELTFKLRELRVGERVHRNLYVSTMKVARLAEVDNRVKAIVAKDPQAVTYYVFIEMDKPGWKGEGIGGRVKQRAALSDANGFLQFADHPKDAPIIHFDGPLVISTEILDMKVGRVTDFAVAVGSRGMGPGTHTCIDYEGVMPENAYPLVEITYPAKKAGDPPIHEKYELKQRC